MNTTTSRLQKAARLQVRPDRACGTRFTVLRPDGSHEHTVRTDPLDCDCEDYIRGMGRRACKHVCAVLLMLAGDDERAEVARIVGVTEIRAPARPRVRCPINPDCIVSHPHDRDECCGRSLSTTTPERFQP